MAFALSTKSDLGLFALETQQHSAESTVLPFLFQSVYCWRFVPAISS